MSPESSPLDVSLKRIMGTIVGILVGQVIGDNSVTIAKLLLYISPGSPYEKWNIVQVSLVVVFVFTAAGVWLGANMAKRGWAEDVQIVLSVVSALGVSLFVIVDQSLPVPTDDSKLPFGETAYLLVSAVILFLLPIFVLPNKTGEFSTRMRYGSGLLVASMLMSAICWFPGFGLVSAFDYFRPFSDFMEGSPFPLGDPLKFWMASPVTINPICGALFVVVFFPLWWKDLWKDRKAYAAIWILGLVAFSFAGAAGYGLLFYQICDGNLVKYECENPILPWAYSFGLASIVVVLTLTVGLAFLVTRVPESKMIGWPVSERFWWLLPLGLAVGFAIVVQLAFRPGLLTGGASDKQIWALTAAHVINGAVLGFTLRMFVLATKLVRGMEGR